MRAERRESQPAMIASAMGVQEALDRASAALPPAGCGGIR